MPLGRYHQAILVETDSDDGSGFIHHVTGDIASPAGMTYESKPAHKPVNSKTYHSQELLGYTLKSSYPLLWDTVLRSLSTPPQQKAPNPRHMGRIEPLKEKLGPGSFLFYSEGEERQPLWKCTEWVEDYALPALQRNHMLMPVPPPAGAHMQFPGSHQASSTASSTLSPRPSITSLSSNTSALSCAASSSSAQAVQQQQDLGGSGGRGWVWDGARSRYRRFDQTTQKWVWKDDGFE